METSPITNIIVDAYYDVALGPVYIYYVRILIKIHCRLSGTFVWSYVGGKSGVDLYT